LQETVVFAGDCGISNTFFNISEFIPFIIQFLLVFGFSYQFPIIMCVITQKGELLKIVKLMFWRNNLRYVIIIVVIFAAVITVLMVVESLCGL